ncbi:MAG: RimK/LysX family protein [Gammaproteobacteria bacterium]|nr:RimK/LysX family protein [Gammaproteobacteria bacterium]
MTMNPASWRFALLTACVSLQSAFGHEPSAKLIIGAVETITVHSLDHQVDARIDTGVTHSSLHAENILRCSTTLKISSGYGS